MDPWVSTKEEVQSQSGFTMANKIFLRVHEVIGYAVELKVDS